MNDGRGSHSQPLFWQSSFSLLLPLNAMGSLPKHLEGNIFFFLPAESWTRAAILMIVCCLWCWRMRSPTKTDVTAEASKSRHPPPHKTCVTCRVKRERRACQDSLYNFINGLIVPWCVPARRVEASRNQARREWRKSRCSVRHKCRDGRGRCALKEWHFSREPNCH